MQDKKFLKLKWGDLTMYELSNRDLDEIDNELGRYRTLANKIYLRRQELYIIRNIALKIIQVVKARQYIVLLKQPSLELKKTKR